MKRTTFIGYFFFFIAAVTSISCEDEDCISFTSNVVSIQFLDSAGNPKDREVSFVRSLEPELFFYPDTILNTYFVPINTAESETTYIIGNPDNFADTLRIGYTRRQILRSPECGFELQFNKVRILSTTFEEAYSLENNLSILNETNIEIYH